MKRFEKMGMSTEAALKWIGECQHRKCEDCPAVDGPKGSVSALCASSYLLSDVPEPPKVPRVALIQTQEDLNKALTDLRGVCFKYRDCEDGCPYYGLSGDAVPLGRCLFAYLSELVEAPESEEES